MAVCLEVQDLNGFKPSDSVCLEVKGVIMGLNLEWQSVQRFKTSMGLNLEQLTVQRFKI